ncbi:MAG: zf-TFIIB domain-containing protein [Candidatus Omnitrophica bacterium]|nr:zf-TFIIB domain-containing protein [Candidatus Omnitrophota bacterium]MBU4479125.1 zf-TFIIB domain-containing protein [Candidatus Omnitrophota bacterium]MCG2703390.1 zf-TFIIB domain-containing protein [Candidatus Omnitrophota bacterium]
MDCPKCLGNLQKKKMEDMEVDVCFVCEGIWFDAGELEAVIKGDSKNFNYIDVGREEFDGEEAENLRADLDRQSGKCPRCEDGTLLMRRKYEKKETVNVDICPKGHGLWLDGGEINSLRERGLVNLHEQMEFFVDTLKFCFSKEGFKVFLKKTFKL